MKRKTLIPLIVLSLILCFSTAAYAHFFSINGVICKWSNNYYDSSKGVRVVDVKYNGDYLNTNWGNVLNTSASNWNSNSNQRALFSTIYYNAAPCKLAYMANMAKLVA